MVGKTKHFCYVLHGVQWIEQALERNSDLNIVRLKVKEAQASLSAARQVVQTQLIATIAESYYTLLMLDEQIAVTTKTVESWREYIRNLRSLMKAGEADRSDVNQAEA